MTCADLYKALYTGEIERILSARAFIRSKFLAALPGGRQQQAESIFGNYGSGSDAERKEVEKQLAESYKDLAGRFYLDETAHNTDLISCLYNLPETVLDKALPAIKKQDPALAEEIGRRIFRFEDLPLLDDRSIQKILREISEEDCIKALKGASAQIQEKLFRNMSKRVGAEIQESIKKLDAAESEIKEAQHELVSIVARLEKNGEILISRSSGDQIVE